MYRCTMSLQWSRSVCHLLCRFTQGRGVYGHHAYDRGDLSFRFSKHTTLPHGLRWLNDDVSRCAYLGWSATMVCRTGRPNGTAVRRRHNLRTTTTGKRCIRPAGGARITRWPPTKTAACRWRASGRARWVRFVWARACSYLNITEYLMYVHRR